MRISGALVFPTLGLLLVSCGSTRKSETVDWNGRMSQAGDTGRLYDGGNAEPDAFVGEIDLAELKAMARYATASDDAFLWKGGFLIELDSGLACEVSHYGNFFRVPHAGGRATYFLLEGKHREAFEAWRRRTMEERIFPFRKSRKSESGS